MVPVEKLINLGNKKIKKTIFKFKPTSDQRQRILEKEQKNPKLDFEKIKNEARERQKLEQNEHKKRMHSLQQK